MFVIIYSSACLLTSAYMARRLLVPLGLRPGAQLAGGFLIFLVLELIPINIILRVVGWENRWVDLIAWVGYLGTGFLSFAATLLLYRDAGWAMAAVCGWVAGWWHSRRVVFNPAARGAAAPVDGDKRRFMVNTINVGIGMAAGLVSGVGFAEARQIPPIKEVDIHLPGLPLALDGFRIAQVTDLHVSPTIKRPFVQGVVERVNTLDADVVALTGDLVDGSVHWLAPEVEPLAALRSRYGNFFVTGNHEYYSGVDQWVRKVESLGFTVLLNEHRLIDAGGGRILLAGVTDYWAIRRKAEHRSDPEKALRGAPPADVKILLAHQPKSAFGAARAGFDLQICGHTHGGQFFPWSLVIGLVQPFVAGLYHYRQLQVYVSRGTGYWGPPLRLGAPAEITLLRLRPGHRTI